jgi:hypothetical protein
MTDINYEELINEIIDITNEYNNNNNYNGIEEFNINNIIEQYKKTLREIKIKNEFIR